MAEFVGQNPRSLALFLNEKKSAIQFINNPQKGTIFGALEQTGEFVAISENAQQSIKTNGLGEITDYQVCDMPSDEGGTFPLITLRGQGNIVGGFSF